MAYKRNREPYPGTGHNYRWHCGHGERAELAGRAGWECWSRRDSIAGAVGWDLKSKYRKPVTHKIERRIARREIYEAVRMEA